MEQMVLSETYWTYADNSRSQCLDCDAGYTCLGGIRSQCVGTTWSSSKSPTCFSCPGEKYIYNFL